MHLLPLVGRELRVALRRPSTFRLRVAFGVGSLGVTFWAFLVWGASLRNPGGMLFAILTWTAAIGAVLSSIFLASDCISRERREDTLGFLFLTDLNPLDVVLGKFAAASLVPGLTLLAMFPSFAVCQLLGGVTITEFWRVILALVITLFFSLAATVYVSSRCRGHRQAYGRASLLLLLLNPLWLCAFAFERYYAAQPLHYLLLLVLFPAVGALFLAGACRNLSTVGAERNSTPVQSPSNAASGLDRSELIDSSPICWLMLRRRGFDRNLTHIASAGMLLLLLVLALNTSNPLLAFFGVLVLLALHLGYQVVVLTRAAYSFYFDRQDGSLELLLGTRIGTEDLFVGFSRFLLRQSERMLLLFVLLDLLFSAVLYARGHTQLSPFPVAMAATLWLSFHGIGWLGVYRSLMQNHPSFAMLTTLARLSLIPWTLSAVFLLAPGTDYLKVATFWVVCSGGFAAFFAQDARAALLRHGRQLLLRPQSEQPPHIESDWSFINWEEALDEPIQSLSPSAGEPGTPVAA